MVLGALVILVIAVGAFQFMGGKPAASDATVATTDADAGDGTTGVEGEEGTDGTVGEEGVDGEVQPVNAIGDVVASLPVRDPFQPSQGMEDSTTPKVVEPPKTVTEPRPPRVASNGGNTPYNPGIGGSLPELGGFGGGQLTPTTPPEPAFRVVGILVGERPIAVFEDDGGNQRLVPLGGSIDGDTKVTKIEQGKVTIERHGKAKTLVMQEKARND